MSCSTFKGSLKLGLAALLAGAILSAPALSQEPLLASAAVNAVHSGGGFVAPVSATIAHPRPEPGGHKFWDNKNRALFAGVAAINVADFAVTRTNLQSGGRELNPITRVFSRSSAGLAANFAGETAAVVGLSYFFHKTGHHKLEKVVSLVSISNSTFAVSYGLTHR